MFRRPLLVIAVLVLFAAAAAGGTFIWRGVSERRKQRDCAGDLIEASRALRSFYKEHGAYPLAKTEREFREVVGGLVHPRRREIATNDRWGRPLHYQSNGEHFLLWSLGKNGTVDRMPGGGKHHGFDVDLVVYDGRFWQQAHGI